MQMESNHKVWLCFDFMKNLSYLKSFNLVKRYVRMVSSSGDFDLRDILLLDGREKLIVRRSFYGHFAESHLESNMTNITQSFTWVINDLIGVLTIFFLVLLSLLISWW